MPDMDNASVPRVNNASQSDTRIEVKPSDSALMAMDKDSLGDKYSEKAKTDAKSKAKERADSNKDKSLSKGKKKLGDKLGDKLTEKDDSALDGVSPNNAPKHSALKAVKDEQAEKEAKENKNSIEKKVAKKAASAAASTAGKYAAANAFILMMKAWLASLFAGVKSLFGGLVAMLASVFSKIAGFAGSVVSAIASAIGCSTLAAAIGLGSTLTFGVGSAVTAVVVSYVNGEVATKDSLVGEDESDCDVGSNYANPRNVGEIDVDAKTLENAKYVYSFLHTLGLPNVNIAGVLGNWSIESGIDPTGVEGIYGEKYTVAGPEKSAALTDLDGYTRNVVFPMYANNGTSINQDAYRATNGDGKYYCGLGLGQFTGPAAYTLMNFAEGANKEWYDLDVQLAYIISPEGYRPTFFFTWETEPNAMTAARNFLLNWEGVNNGTDGMRGEKAEYWLTEMASWEVDSVFANSVISMAGDVSVSATQQARNSKLAKCGNERSAEFTGVIAADIKVGDILGGTSDPCVNNINLAEYLGKHLANLIGSDGNIKPEYRSATKTSIIREFDKWKGQCVGWSAARIPSYVEAKYGVKVQVGRFGDGGDPARDGMCLHTPPISGPIPNSVFSDPNCSSYGHTGYVEYVCPDGGLIISECNVDNAEHFFISYVPPGTYNDWMFFSVDDIYEVNKGSTYWDRHIAP